MQHAQMTHRGGFTLLEVVVAAFILAVLSVGALGYQYHSMRDARHAEAQAAAARLAKMVLDHWKGLNAPTDYNPVSFFSESLTITQSQHGPGVQDDSIAFVILGHYRIKVGSEYYFLTCSYSEASFAGPRLLNVVAAWRPDLADGELGDDARRVSYSVFGMN